MLMTVVRPSPANTLIVDDRIVISTATAGLGPALESTPTCQRCAVLKNLAWPVRSLGKTCGGGGAGGAGPPKKPDSFPSGRKAPTRPPVPPPASSRRTSAPPAPRVLAPTGKRAPPTP